jgi:hypothetical protein
MYDRVNEQAFDSFDPDNFDVNSVESDRFDPDNASGHGVASQAATAVKNARAGQKLQLNIVLSNPTAKGLNFELFNALDSVTSRCKADLVTDAEFPMIPQLSLEGLAAAGLGVTGFDKNGNFVNTSNVGGNPKASISCNEYPYKSLFESTKVLPFNVAFLRFTSNTDAQIDNNIYHKTRTIGGGEKQNVISPRAYFKPNQFQSRTIDITAPFSISGEKGVQMLVNAGESVRLAFFIQRWTKSSI